MTLEGDTDDTPAVTSDDVDRDGYASDVDCDDEDAAIHPNMPEICNGKDDDCDLLVDSEDAGLSASGQPGAVQRFVDADGDGAYSAVPRWFCSDPGLPNVPPGEDCDDADPRTFPGAASAEPGDTCKTDADEDGYGSLTPKPGVAPGEDCVDSDGLVHPNAAEVFYDDADQNCDPSDEWDADGDGRDSTAAPGGGDDCDDSSASVFPGARDIANDGVDQDCVGGDNTCTEGSSASCPALDCKDLYDLGRRASGVNWIKPGAAAIQAYCDQDTSGGGWTLVAVVAEDGAETWTWNSRDDWLGSTGRTFGDPDHRAADMRSLAYEQVGASEVLFENARGGVRGSVWARYVLGSTWVNLGAFVAHHSDGVAHMDPHCYGSGAGALSMTTGSLSAVDRLCSTSLYVSPQDQDGAGTCGCVNCDAHAFAFAWSVDNGDGCPLDDVGNIGGVGPTASSPTAESNAFGFLYAAGHMSASVDSLWVLVRR